jgi:uncharacterized protein (TIGR03083 family)
MTRVSSIPALGHAEAMEMAAVEYGRMSDMLRGLQQADWEQPTDCDRWTVKDIVSHIVGITESLLSVRELRRQGKEGKRFRKELGFNSLDAGNEVQVLERRHLHPEQVRAAYEEIVPRMLRRRTRTPALARKLVPIPNPLGGLMSLGYLFDIVLTRDIWTHRVDINRATGAELVLTSKHDGRFVAIVVAEWARRHGKPFTLHLEGPAGGTYQQGVDGESLRLDAVEFCRILSGRGEGDGLLATKLVF